MLDYLCMRGASVEALDKMVGKECFVSLAANLIAHGEFDIQGRTPLHWAAYKDHAITAQFLLRHRQANIDVRDVDGRLPIHWCAAKDNIKTLTVLLEFGGENQIDEKDNFGKTPDEWALEREPPSRKCAAHLRGVRSRKHSIFW